MYLTLNVDIFPFYQGLSPASSQVPADPASLFLSSGVDLFMTASPLRRYQLRCLLIPKPQSLWEVYLLQRGSSVGHSSSKGCTWSTMEHFYSLGLFFFLLFLLFSTHLFSLCSVFFSCSTVFCPFLNVFSQYFHSIFTPVPGGLSFGLWWVHCKAIWNSCIWHKIAPGLSP